MMGDEPLDLEVRHPFLFFIMNEEIDTVLFVGKVVDPTDLSTITNMAHKL